MMSHLTTPLYLCKYIPIMYVTNTNTNRYFNTRRRFYGKNGKVVRKKLFVVGIESLGSIIYYQLEDF